MSVGPERPEGRPETETPTGHHGTTAYRPEVQLDMLAAALEYVGRSLAVIPLHTPIWFSGEWRCSCGERPCKDLGKHPRPRDGGSYGLHHAITDDLGVRLAWQTWPDANIGLVVPSGRFVLDLDAAGKWWQELMNQHGRVVTRTARTGRGYHLWFRTPTPVRDGVLVSGDDWKVEVVAGGKGYVVAPPSRHRSGRLYEWTDTRDAAEAPGWLLELVTVRARQPEPNGERPTGGKIPDDRKRSEILREVGRLRREGHDDESVTFVMERWIAQWCENPDTSGLAAMVRSTGGYLEPPRMTPKLGSSEAQETGVPYRAETWLTDPRTVYWYFAEQDKPLVCAKDDMFWEPATLQRTYWRTYGRVPTKRWMIGEWPDLRNRLLNEAPLRVAPPELTLTGRVRGMVRHYCGDTPPDDPSSPRAKPTRLDENQPWWDLEVGRVVFGFNALIASHHGTTSPGDRIERRAIRKAIEDMGGEVSVRLDLPPGHDGKRNRPRLTWLPFAALRDTDD